DEYGRNLLKGLPAGLHTLSYGLQAAPQGLAQVRGNIARMDAHGLTLEVSTPWGAGKLESALFGKFNASNLLAVLAALLLMDMPLEEALTRLARAKTVPGRMERFSGAAHQSTLVVDYAHTPDALRQALTDLRAHLGGEAKLWCVFGCGGERDRGKRPLMGAMAEQYADYLVVTDDNPRNEDAVSIIADILSGMSNPDGAYIQRDRAQAIAFAAQHAAQHDVVLIAGKGHEEYQIMGGRKIPFSDRREVRRLLHLNGGSHGASSAAHKEPT
ncbi:MAG: UDP-N-acetylmuramyl-tripeptide synthetase, partial [Gammaproteobacteria bacterium]|nr:UDP-N-acetylmuramyl-tripeptide synthetase [Gammaproteobacteria bacterium]